MRRRILLAGLVCSLAVLLLTRALGAQTARTLGWAVRSPNASI